MKGNQFFGIVMLVLCFLGSKAQIQRDNFVKINLTSVALKNYSAQYERVLNKHFSALVAFRSMPSTSLPFKDQILKAMDNNDPDAKNTIEKLKLANMAITPEFRFYTGKKGYGRGFYLATFYRYARYETNSLSFHYEGASTSGTMDLSGSLTSHTGGLLLGAQWFLGKYIVLDWWIFGPHYGVGKGDFKGVSSKPLSQQEQDDLRSSLDDIDIPLTDKTVTVTANSASMKLSGPWGGVRAGLCLGVRF
jgi:hypothetical protein